MIIICDDDKKEYGEFCEIIEKLESASTKTFLLPKKSYIELNFVDKESIREINARERGVDAVTDVLSFPNLDGIFGKRICLKYFPFDIDPDTGMLNLGAIVVCIDKIKEQAEEYGTGQRREFSYLLAHGILHLLGYDHMTADEKSVMRKKEEELLKKANV